jgi:hypothetical protein
MRTRPGMTFRTRTAFALCSGIGLSLATMLASCSSSESNTSTQQGGTNDGSGGTTNTTSGGSTGNATGGATGPGVWALVNVGFVPATSDGVPAHAQVDGFPTDSAPLPDLFTVQATAGDCKLYKPTYPLCDAPKCTTDETCVADNKCAKKPAAVGMGDLTFSGLAMADGSSSYILKPLSATIFSYTGVGVNYPPCSAGTDVTVAGGADAATAFSVKTSCIEPLVVTGADPLPFDPAKATQVTWTPPSIAGKSRVYVEVDVSHHGNGLKGQIICEAADSGSLEITANLVSGLIALGTAGFPELRLKRISTASAAAGSGKATLNVQMIVPRALAIPGLKSCTEDADCDPGQVCGTGADNLKCVPG